MANWIVKGKVDRNESHFLKAGTTKRWVTRKPPKGWARGDTLFFWKSSPHLCLAGVGEMVKVFDRDDAGDAYFDVRYLVAELPHPISIAQLREDPVVSSASFLKAGAAGTVFPLGEEQAAHLARVALAENAAALSATDRAIYERLAAPGGETPRAAPTSTARPKDNAPETASSMNALLVREPFIDWILDGKKTWELRGSNTKTRGRIALAKSGSGHVFGTCELVDCLGPLSLDVLRKNTAKLNCTPKDIGDELYYANTYAWVIRDARRLAKLVPYDHPSGAVIWVKLQPHVVAAALAET